MQQNEAVYFLLCRLYLFRYQAIVIICLRYVLNLLNKCMIQRSVNNMFFRLYYHKSTSKKKKKKMFVIYLPGHYYRLNLNHYLWCHSISNLVKLYWEDLRLLLWKLLIALWLKALFVSPLLVFGILLAEEVNCNENKTNGFS